MRALQLSIHFLVLIFFIGCSSAKINEDTSNQSTESKIVSIPNKGNELDSALNDLTEQIVNSLSEERKSKLAVLEFVDLKGNTTDFGRFIAEELITRLYKTKKFYVIERQLLNKVLEEHKLTATGLIDENSAKELGKILGVDAIASGTVTELTNSVKVNSRLFSTETGSIFAVASSEIPKSSDVRKLLGVTSGYEKIISSDTNKETKSFTTKNHEAGLKGEYFNLPPNIPNSLPDNPTFTRVDKNIDFEWAQQSPAPNITSDYFGIRWTGMIYIPITGTYKFNLGTDDGNKLWVDEKLLINRWSKGAQDDYGELYLIGDRWYSIKVEYFELGGRAAAFLRWIPLGENNYQAIPSKSLRTE
jgi:TolB-like protein